MCATGETEPNSTSYRQILVFLLIPMSWQTNSLLCNNTNFSSEDNRVFLKHRSFCLWKFCLLFLVNCISPPWETGSQTRSSIPGLTTPPAMLRAFWSAQEALFVCVFFLKKQKTSSAHSHCDREVKVEPKWNCSKIFLESSALNEQIQVTLFCIHNLGV